MLKFLRSQRGQTTVEILVGVIGIAAIALAVSQALNVPLGDMHDKVVNGIVSVTGSGM
jgi:hypothetical protein